MAKGQKKRGGASRKGEKAAKPVPSAESAPKKATVAATVRPGAKSAQRSTPRFFPLWGYGVIIGLFALVLGLGLVPFQFFKQYKADDNIVYFLYFAILIVVVIASAYDRVFDYLEDWFREDEN